MFYFCEMQNQPPFLHPLDTQGTEMPTAFTYPFRYAPHPLCEAAAAIVKEKLKELQCNEAKMFGVLVVEGGFLAAYSGQLAGSYAHPWFVPPIVDYLNPESHFQKEQAEIDKLNGRIAQLECHPELSMLRTRLNDLSEQRDEAVEKAKIQYERGKKVRDEQRRRLAGSEDEALLVEARLIAESQQQKADVKRARQLNNKAIEETKALIALRENNIGQLRQERKMRSEALQEWLFNQFVFLNAKGEQRSLVDIFDDFAGSSHSMIPSGAGECCAPKLLNAAYALGLKPIAMAEFWWGSSPRGLFRRQGEFYPACNRKCRPILSFMLQGLNVAPDPARHYEQIGADVEVLWEDAWMAVIVKPTGWLSVPGKTLQPNVKEEAMQRWPDASGPIIVHRLDQDTSGLMILAKTQMSYSWLQKMFEKREIRKRYVALLDGSSQSIKKSGLIRLPLSPDYDDLPRQKVDYEHGLEAVTKYEVIEVGRHLAPRNRLSLSEGHEYTRISFYPLTGRTHQLRVHAASPEGLDLPIVGDRLYGNLADRLYLHAEALDFIHPATGEQLHFESEPPF